MPYYLIFKGISERMKRSFKKHNIKLYHKAGETLRQKLVHLKDKLQDEEKCGVVYKAKCKVCGEWYIEKQEERCMKEYVNIRNQSATMTPNPLLVNTQNGQAT